MKAAGLFAILLMTLVPYSLSAAAKTSSHIPRFQQVIPNLYRGGQPDREGFADLKHKGIKTIVNLRVEDDERQTVEGLGMQYVHIPVTLNALTSANMVPLTSIEAFFKILADPSAGPVFVHCERGADRTGAMISFVRIVALGWDAQRAYQEARVIGMRWWNSGLKEQILNFNGTALAAQVRTLSPGILRKED
jgi:tyrosine-protein phosphatase SIW14